MPGPVRGTPEGFCPAGNGFPAGPQSKVGTIYRDTLLGEGETSCMTRGLGPFPREAHVTLIKKIKVAAGSAVLCPVRLYVGMEYFLVVPGDHVLSDTLLMPHTFNAGGESTAVCLINAPDKDVVLAAEIAVGHAVEADLHVPVPFLSWTVCTLAEVAPPQEVPVHLQELLEDVRKDYFKCLL